MATPTTQTKRVRENTYATFTQSFPLTEAFKLRLIENSV